MTRRISLALTLHNHQPVGNFGWVFADVFERAYRPMVEAIERHPGIHLGLHYTGPLLEWMQAEQPAFIARLRGLVERGQVEILGGGLFEPVLASLPEQDRIAQLERMAGVAEELFGLRPTGAWLAERVWEPDIPTSLVAAGYTWTILDDAHFRAAAIAEDAMWGPYTTEDQGRLVTVFGTEQGLRYRIPFHEVDEVIDYLREHATEGGERVGTMGDDGEKFGAWPTTWEHCWGEGRWVERFFEALDANADWLSTVRPSDWLAANPPIGRAYIPTSSYAEMGEWALPADESRAFGAALRHAREAGAPEARWLQGAFWRNFQVKYREVNDLHKQMLRASAKVASLADGPARIEATDHLHRGQSNDSYWHGLFGGIYIAHMRAATLEHLIAAEDIADRELGHVDASEIRDLDLDGRDEVLFANAGQVVTVDLDEGAGIGSWDLRAARHAVTSVMRRRPEAYHETLRRHAVAVQPGVDAAAALDHVAAVDGEADREGTAPASIHEIVRTKEAGLAAHLTYDGYERRSALVRFLPLDQTATEWRAGGGPDLGDFVDEPFRLVELAADRVVVGRDGWVTVDAGAPQAVWVEKRIALGGGRLDPTLGVQVSLENRSHHALRSRVGVEWAMTMLGGGGNPAAWWEVAGERARHDGASSAAGLGRLGQGNDWLGLEIATSVSPAADAWWAPIETVSNSEDGFERVYQGSALLLSWPVGLQPGERWSGTVDHRVSVARDRGQKRRQPAACAPRADER
ncbi:MAG TPA: alpha-amylase/4-alpha-glucanotransferase domain-containing protein [Candidatus Eisenbacteria bacterium]|nr:alpha-amylase/4-alpha-glucanotransferase domain-containing protein [Candidatus Eisenbacteria bacterium]